MADSETDPTKPRPSAEPDDEAADASTAIEPAGDPEIQAPEVRAPEVEVSKPPETSPRNPPSERAILSAPVPPPPKPRKSDRVVATLALLLSLAAVGAAGYLTYKAWMDDPNARFEASIGAYQADLAKMQRATTDDVAALRADLTTVGDKLAAQREALSEARAAMADAVAANMASAPPAPRAWKMAEVEYLLTIANHRLRLQRDAAGAQSLLAASDQVLADVDDFRFHEVRALLADEQLALRTFEYTDTQGVFLRLEAVKRLLDDLPLRLPEYIAEDGVGAPAIDEDASMIDAFLERLGGLVRFRRHEGGAIRPLLAPAEAEYLEQHLRLAFERAQLAVLRRDQGIYETSLRAARDWLHRFVDPGRSSVVETLRELDELQNVDLDVQPPDISRSLARFRELRRGNPDEQDEAATK